MARRAGRGIRSQQPSEDTGPTNAAHRRVPSGQIGATNAAGIIEAVHQCCGHGGLGGSGYLARPLRPMRGRAAGARRLPVGWQAQPRVQADNRGAC